VINLGADLSPKGKQVLINIHLIDKRWQSQEGALLMSIPGGYPSQPARFVPLLNPLKYTEKNTALQLFLC